MLSEQHMLGYGDKECEELKTQIRTKKDLYINVKNALLCSIF